MEGVRILGLASLLAIALAGCNTGGSIPTTAAPNASASPQARPVQSAAPESIGGTSATLVVHGMSCPLCAHNVDKQLLAVPGVKKVDLDMGTGQAKLQLDGTGRTTKSQLAKAIDDSGFTLVEVRVP